jgi:serine/threonine protein kinase, bacterial
MIRPLFTLGFGFSLILFWGMTPSAFAKNEGDVKTLTGSVIPGANNGTFSESSFLCPNAVAVDRDGNVYIADTLNSVIRKAAAVGEVTTLSWTPAGVTQSGPATNAALGEPTGVAVDSSRNVYIAERGANRISEITPRGVMNVVAGTGMAGSADGPATAASFNSPSGLAMDKDGNIYVADTANHLVRKITPDGKVSTLAGSGTPGSSNGAGKAASFNRPTGVAVDSTGDLYVADEGNNLIRKISPDGTVSTLAGTGAKGWDDGPATVASFNRPFGVAVDFYGTVFVADTGNNVIRQVTPDGTVTTLAGTGVKGSSNGKGKEAAFKYPQGIAVDPNGNLYVADTGNSMIREIR